MEYVRTKRFDRSLKKLNITKKIRENIFNNFRDMTLEQASQYSYLKGKYKTYKKYKLSQYRILFSYCLECYGKYSTFFKCDFCDGDNLQLLVLHDIQKRSTAYR
jgi:mRNA-degrading endonuclease RelE of RelBE toxin-antitoxin system